MINYSSLICYKEYHFYAYNALFSRLPIRCLYGKGVRSYRNVRNHNGCSTPMPRLGKHGRCVQSDIPLSVSAHRLCSAVILFLIQHSFHRLALKPSPPVALTGGEG